MSTGIERQVILDALLRQDRAAGGDVADDGHATARGKLISRFLRPHRGGRCFLRLLFERDGAALARALFDESHLLQMLDVEMDGGGRLEPQRLADLAHGGRIAVQSDALFNVIVHALLHSG